MSMTKDKSGNFIFQKGKEYRMKAFVNPVWRPGTTSRCAETKDFEDVPNKQGLFTNGDDTRWWVANDQFEEA